MEFDPEQAADLYALFLPNINPNTVLCEFKQNSSWIVEADAHIQLPQIITDFHRFLEDK